MVEDIVRTASGKHGDIVTALERLSYIVRAEVVDTTQGVGVNMVDGTRGSGSLSLDRDRESMSLCTAALEISTTSVSTWLSLGSGIDVDYIGAGGSMRILGLVKWWE
ncbi:hypothetical protein Tco_0257544 [Tanacetum coccineum]